MRSLLVLFGTNLKTVICLKNWKQQLLLIKQNDEIKFTDGSPVTDHLNVFKGIINQLAGMGIKFEDEIQGLWLLGSILNKEMRKIVTRFFSHSDVLSQKGRGEVKSRGPSDFGVVRMGNTGLSRIAGIGDICLKFDTGMELVLHNVKHVPDMRLKYYLNRSLDDGWLPKPVLISKSIVNAVDNDDITELWHKRLRKQTRLAFKSRPSFRTENILDLVHSDVCGPIKTKTLGGCSYFVTFIDDHSRKVWVYTLKTKDQVLDVFKQFHALVERQTGKKLKCIRSDNGGEYIGPFDGCVEEHGISASKSLHRRLPASFWGEALNTAVHVINLTPCVPLRFDVPDRVWSGKDVSYHHLRVFGCKASVHIPKDERSKLDVKNKPCVFLGYGQDELRGFGDDIQNDEEQNDEEHGADDVDAQEQPNLDEDVHPEVAVPIAHHVFHLGGPLEFHHLSHCYSANERALKNKLVYKLETERVYFLERGTRPDWWLKGFSTERKAFSWWIMDKDIYMEQPEGFQVKGRKISVCRLQRVCYGEACTETVKNIEKMDRVPYASAVGSLMYAMVCTRPDLAHAVGVVSRFLSNPGKKHWEAVKWIFRYLRGTSKLGITFGNGKPMLVGYTDSDLAGNKDNMKSTSGYLMTFAGGAVSWQSRLQKCVALSTTEAEYVAATEACKELLW
ncbi:putative RNA-directed DNA polymerase [Tanacetum coccineum]